jgi:hypothetical protein
MPTNIRSCTFTPTYIFMWFLIKHRDKLTILKHMHDKYFKYFPLKIIAIQLKWCTALYMHRPIAKH